MKVSNKFISKIILSDIKTAIIFIACIIGAFICYSYLDSIDAIELFTLSSITLFTTLFFISLLIFAFLFILFAMHYLDSYYLNKYLDQNKTNIIELRYKHHRTSSTNIFLIHLLLFGIANIIIFYLLDDKNKLSHDYLFLESVTVHSIILIIPVFIVTFFINRDYYQFLSSNIREYGNKIELFLSYLFYTVALPNLFSSVWFVISTFSGVDLLRDYGDFSIFIIYFFILAFVYAISMERIELTTKDKIMKIFTINIICIALMWVVSLFYDTSFSYNLMKLVGKADKRNYPYIINNKMVYALPDVKDNIYCGKVLWRGDNVIVLLPQNKIDKKKDRIMIDKKDIYPLQGEERLTYCNE
ncbi:hypothetical protein [Bibersteinia trehalosi]|uniref:hypothetical protein n=1 Tax=Bibersteinia trehalosi TaxID=47735 RepID=UPI002D79D8F6|nr:hypothetical protein [Bibersteinia trehalosi]